MVVKQNPDFIRRSESNEAGYTSTDVMNGNAEWALKCPQIREPITARRPAWSFRGRNCTKVPNLSRSDRPSIESIDSITSLDLRRSSLPLLRRTNTDDNNQPTMPAKKNAAQPAPSAAATTQASTTAAGSVPASSPISAPAAKNAPANWDKVLQNIYQYYMKETPQRTKLIDVFLVFIAVVGALQFLYCILAGNYVRYHPRPSLWKMFLERTGNRTEECWSIHANPVVSQPFNAFLSGFGATVGQFVLTSTCFDGIPDLSLAGSNSELLVSLRIQTTAANKSEFPEVSPERYDAYDQPTAGCRTFVRGVHDANWHRRAFADYVVCSLILHFFCVNFIN